jgi:hypothetical protein
MNDYDNLKDILEIAEVLSGELERKLEVKAVNETTNEILTVVFEFNRDNELTGVYLEN